MVLTNLRLATTRSKHSSSYQCCCVTWIPSPGLGVDQCTAPMTLTTIKPPTCDFQPQLQNIQQISTSVNTRAPSPGAPEYSPITPKTHPAIPAVTEQTIEPKATVDSSTQPQHGETNTTVTPAPIPVPPSRPFSSDESTDGLALKAAISSLQFQRQQARDDIQSLQEIKKQALADPERFTQDLVAGKIKETRHEFGSAQRVLDASSGTERGGLPGPQNVVRMPYINWDKYNIMGEPLEVMHEQQRRYPGSAPFQQNKGREFSVTAPYSPFQDGRHVRNPSDGSRKDSTPNSVASTPVTAEHPYETRRSSKYQAQ